MASLVVAPNGNYEDRMQVELNEILDVPESVEFRNPEPNNITMFAGGSEMLKVGPDGFWVRGVQVPQDEKEALAVYNAMKEWLAWVSLTRE